MKVAVFESIVTPAGHEHDFDKMLVAELLQGGHQVEFFVPENYPFKVDYGVPVRALPGEAVSYAGASGLGKLLLAGKREWRRLKWFDALYEAAKAGSVDAIIIPTATYRFLRTIRRSRLKASPKPVIPILHGINDRESGRFFRQVEALAPCRQIRPAVITLGERLFDRSLPSVRCVKPPVFPMDATFAGLATNPVLTLGFFGQYRREKNLEGFLDVFGRCRFSEPVKLFVQGATVLPGDAADFERIRLKYARAENIEFLHKALIGEEWQRAIASVDALIMPYAAERYRYHWSAMLFTAIGSRKPVIIAESINPEVLAEYHVGLPFRPGREDELQRVLETFVNTYGQQKERYQAELDRANADFAPSRFVAEIAALMA